MSNINVAKKTKPTVTDMSKPSKRKFHSVGEIKQQPLEKRCAFYTGHMHDVLLNPDVMRGVDRVFSHTIHPKISVVDQKQTGTCWIAAGLNMIRPKIIKKLKLSGSFEFSRSHLFFWSKIEKINMRLHEACATKDMDLDSDEVRRVYHYGVGDSGTFNFFKHLVNKYGVMPQTVFGEDTVSKYSGFLGSILKKELIVSINQIRASEGDGYNIIPEIMEHYKQIMAIVMSVPPSKFTFRYSVKGAVKSIGPITPLKFYQEHCDIDLNDYICVVSDPRHDMNQVLRIKDKRWIVDTDEYDFFNLPMKRLVHLTKQSVLDNEALYFSVDCSLEMRSAYRIMSTKLYYQNLLGLKHNKGNMMDRAQRFITGSISTCHAMTIRGVDIQEKEIKKKEKNTLKGTTVRRKFKQRIVKWEVDNSWGGDGTYVMEHNWFKKNVGLVAVKKSVLTKEEKAAYESAVKNSTFKLIECKDLN